MKMDPNQRISGINPFLGSDEPGNCLCGPYLPFGAVRPGPDVVFEAARGATNGYRSDQPIRNFSQIHVSGTGGGGRYGNIGIMPSANPTAKFPTPLKPKEAVAKPGYFSVCLGPDTIQTEITATNDCAVYRFHFTSGLPTIFIDPSTRLLKGGDCIQADLQPAGEDCLAGSVQLKGGWGHDQPYTFFFYIKCNAPWTALNIDEASHPSEGPQARLQFSETDNPLELRIGVSRVSITRAKQAVHQQALFPFSVLRERAEKAWQDEISRFALEGEPEDIAMFDTMLHRLYAMPSDLGSSLENPRWSSEVPQLDDFFCLWDSCRNANSFFHLFKPKLSGRFAACWLDIAKHTGWLPDAWISQHHGFMQGGCSADLILSEAFRKGVTGFDASQALDFMRKNAESDSPDPDFYGRYRGNYQKIGYVTPDETAGCVSRQIEYSLHDWSIARLAEQLGHTQLAEHYDCEAEKIWNLWHPERRCFYPKDQNGQWMPDFDIRKPSRPPEEGHYSSDPYFFEGTGLEWIFCAVHVLPEIIQRMGGPSVWIERLDRFFESEIFAWKEIILHSPFLYHYAGRPDLSTKAVRRQMKRYKNQPDGIPDNEDMGSHSAFWLLTSLGLYPVMGQLYYLLVPPRFEYIQVPVGPDQKTLTIIREGPADGTIAQVYWNDMRHSHSWINHHDLVKGGTLKLKTAYTASHWGYESMPPKREPF